MDSFIIANYQKEHKCKFKYCWNWCEEEVNGKMNILYVIRACHENEEKVQIEEKVPRLKLVV